MDMELEKLITANKWVLDFKSMEIMPVYPSVERALVDF